MNGRILKYLSIALLSALSGCMKNAGSRDWTITLRTDDKGPYGAYLAFQSLKYYFPDASVETLSPGFRYTNMRETMKFNYYGRSLLILEGISFRLSEPEWKDLKQFIKNGNEVVLFSSALDNNLENELGLYKTTGDEENTLFYQNKADFNNKDILTLTDVPGQTYGYEGRSLKSFFTVKTDTPAAPAPNNVYAPAEQEKTHPDEDLNLVPDTLGFAYNSADILRYTIGEGHLTLHAAPLVLSNYFLLQPENIRYLTNVWRTLPQNINRVYWNGYFHRSVDSSGWGVLWRYASTRAALLLGIFLLLVYVLFEGKRKQRMIPITAPLRNDSVSFVETVGRLYYNKGNHNNLAEKMVQQFLEWVRAHYFLNTNLINENFIGQLTIKSGRSEANVRNLVEMITEIKTHSVKPDDAYLYQLYNSIQEFYKNHHK